MTAAEPRVADTVVDFRIADFKLLLPIGTGSRTLVLHEGEAPPWLGLLEQEGTRADAHALGSPNAPSGSDYDVVISIAASDPAATGSAPWWPAVRNAQAWLHITTDDAGGPGSPSLPDGWSRLAHWHAIPDWPEFRNLIGGGANVARGAAHELKLLRAEGSTLERTVARLRAEATLKTIASARLELRGRGQDRDQRHSIAQQLCHVASETTGETLTLDRSVLLSGRLGEGNPILLFLFDEQANPLWLWKVGRFADRTHLTEERVQIEELVAAMGPTVAERVIAPAAHRTIEGHEALLYRYEPCHPFYGVRWRLQARRNYCLALASWLSDLAEATRRSEVTATQRDSLDCLDELIERRALPDDLHDDAQRARSELADLLPRYGALEHGDLGMYNTRLSRADGSDFKVIDWGSSAVCGLAFADLCYALSTLNAPDALARQCLQLYAEGAGLEIGSGYACWLGYMARRWVELDQVAPEGDGVNLGGGQRLIDPTRRIRGYFDGTTAANGGAP